MTLGPVQMKDVEFWNFIRVRMPARWTCVRKPAGNWGCYDEEADAIALWVDFDVYVDKSDFASDEEFRLHHIGRADDVIPPTRLDNTTSPARKFERSPSHVVFNNVTRAEADGELYHNTYWTHYGTCRPQVIFVHLSFEMPVSLLTEEDFRDFHDYMNEQLMNATIDWASAPSSEKRTEDDDSRT